MARNLIVNVGTYNDVTTDHLSMTTISPGGCGEVTWTFETRPPYLGLLDLRENDRAEVFDRQGLVWRGRLEGRRPALQFGTGTWSIVARGYAASLRDQFYTSTKQFAAATAIEDIFKTVRNDLAPDIASSNALIVATNRTLSAQSRDLVGKTAQDIFDQARQIGNNTDTPLFWHVWEGAAGSAQKAQLELVARPASYGYITGLAQGAIVNLDWDISRLYNRIVVEWGPSSTRTTVDDTTSQSARPAGYGLIRTKLLQDSTINSGADATNVGNTLLQAYKRIRAMAGSIQIPGTAIVEDDGGSSVPPWRVKAGKIIRIRELRAGGVAIPDYDFLIASTSWDEGANMLTLTPEGQEDVANIIGRYLRRERLT